MGASSKRSFRWKPNTFGFHSLKPQAGKEVAARDRDFGPGLISETHMPAKRVPALPAPARQGNRNAPAPLRILLKIGRLLKDKRIVVTHLAADVREGAQPRPRNKACFQPATSIAQTTLVLLPAFTTGAQTAPLRSFSATWSRSTTVMPRVSSLPVSTST